MSSDHQDDRARLAIGEPFPTEGTGELPPLQGSREERPATASERYRRIFNDPGLSPPDGTTGGPPPVSAEAFHGLTH